MILMIDCGNTSTTFALVKHDGSIAEDWRVRSHPQRTADEIHVWLDGAMRLRDCSTDCFTDAVIASVVPELNKTFLEVSALVGVSHPLVVGSSLCVSPIEVKIENVNELGADRLANAAGAKATYPGAAIVVDFGTATNFDVVDANACYRGGAIAPGIELSTRALHVGTARLPQISVAKPDNAIGTNTIEALGSGLYWGYIGMIESITRRIKESLASDNTKETPSRDPVSVIATGGYADLFSQDNPTIDIVDHDLTLKGLHAIWQHNRQVND